MLSESHREALLNEIQELESQLSDLHDCRVVNDDPAEREATLLILQGALKWRLDIDATERRDNNERN